LVALEGANLSSADRLATSRIVHVVPLVSHTGDVALARAEFDRRPGANLRYCLRKRFVWMQRYLGPESFAVEVGCGAGFSEKFIHAGRLELTDAEPRPWVSRVVDAHELPYTDASVDVLIANNVIHHLAYPDRFFREAGRVLRPGGHLLVQECNLGKTTEWALRITGHEGFDWSADPFDASRPCNDPKDPWSANCAIPNLLFDDLASFRMRYPMFEVAESGLSEFFIHFNNGGISARVPYVPLPEAALRVVDAVDSALVAIAPRFFAAQRRVAFRRV
jgi:SAM-dependent methyltransferase